MDEKENPLQNAYLIKVDDIEKIDETAIAINNLDAIFIYLLCISNCCWKVFKSIY